MRSRESQADGPESPHGHAGRTLVTMIPIDEPIRRPGPRRVFVAGANGYIGRALVAELVERGDMLFELTGQRPKFRRLPLLLFDVVSAPLRVGSLVVPSLKEKVELAPIGRYYATEPMLLLDPETDQYDADATPEYGTDTLGEFYVGVLRRGLEGHELGEQGLF